jgi:hypothetical protein
MHSQTASRTCQLQRNQLAHYPARWLPGVHDAFAAGLLHTPSLLLLLRLLMAPTGQLHRHPKLLLRPTPTVQDQPASVQQLLLLPMPDHMAVHACVPSDPAHTRQLHALMAIMICCSCCINASAGMLFHVHCCLPACSGCLSPACCCSL